MKMFWKKEDGAIDNLLRAHAARPGSQPPLCKEFDPDLASAFIEHSLTARDQARYEQHLSLCASCRKSVVTLARMAAAETAFSSEAKLRGGFGEARARRLAWLGALTRPQWAMAAAAVVILAISAPLFLSRQGKEANGEAKQSETAQSQAPQPLVAQSAPSTDGPADNELTAGESAQSSGRNQDSSLQRRSVQKSADSAGTDTGSSDEPGAGNNAGAAKSAPPELEQVEGKRAAQNNDQIAKDINQVPVADSVPPAPETQLEKIDSDKAKSVSEQGKEKAEVSVLKSARPDGDERGRSAEVIRPENDIAPPSSSSSRDRKAMAAPPGSLSIRNSRLTDSARNRGGATERKVGSKRFWLKDGIWIDKDYNPDKEMPVVTIIRDSDVFKELLSKRQGMKSFLTEFNEHDRVIFIYKGTVYKLIPQEVNN